MSRLNPNQLRARINGVISALAVGNRETLPEDDQLFYIMEKAGIIDRIEGFLGKERPASAPVEPDNPTSASGTKIEDLAAARDEILVGLYEKAKAGDAQSARAFADISAENAPQDRFNIQVNITPASVPDRMLKAVNLQAAPFHVDEGLEGLELRMEIDEAPHDLRQLCKQFRAEFAKWCETAYAPKDTQ